LIQQNEKSGQFLMIPPRNRKKRIRTSSLSSSTTTSSVSLGKNRSNTTRKEAKTTSSGAPPNQIDIPVFDDGELKPGRLVAAQIAKLKKPQQWILARVVRYLLDKKKYEVEDEDPGDDENNPVRKHYILSIQHVVPLPQGDVTDPEYPKDSTVFAVFPNTTTFYTAIVVAPPKKKRNGEYTLRFADDEDEQGHTPIRKVPTAYVVHLPPNL